ncbi:50S ribosomal protein L3 [Patescibacteria group bacterium]|nr:50S ribosomal protein L3 [Patescibacteria group bacterium]
MAKFILGKKLNMSQKFSQDGRVVPVTVVEAGPCTVVQVKGEKDGYQAVQLGFGTKKKANKPMAGHLKGLNTFRYLKEFRLENAEGFERGKVIDLTSFEAGDKLKITSTSKGKGFQGVVKRHGFHGSPASHGHKDQLRMPGSIGATDSARVFKGTRMGGRMGGDTVTVANLELVEVDNDKNLLYIKGAVPGGRNALVFILADGDIKFAESKAVKEEVKEQPVEAKQDSEVKEDKLAEDKPKEVKSETPSKTEGEEPKAEEEPSTKIQADNIAENKESKTLSEVEGEKK